MSDKQPLGPNQTFWLQELRSGKYDQGKTFAEIADIIEQDPSVYFKEPR